MVFLISSVGSIFLLGATVLLVLASVSTPVVKSFYFLHVNTSPELRMGMWGYCQGAVCTGKHLGYRLADGVAGLTTNGDNVPPHAISYALILNPIAAGVTFIAFLLAATHHLLFDLIASLFAGFAFLVTLVTVIINCVVWITARHRLNENNTADATLGKAFWFVIAALIAIFIGTFTTCCGSFGERRRRRRDYDYPATTEAGVGGRRRFW